MAWVSSTTGLVKAGLRGDRLEARAGQRRQHIGRHDGTGRENDRNGRPAAVAGSETGAHRSNRECPQKTCQNVSPSETVLSRKGRKQAVF